MSDKITILLMSMAFAVGPIASLQAQQAKELGKVQWIRNFDEGLEQASRENKAVFLLFQEVPGCLTCQRYGDQVLSHPLIVEAIETYFVPVAIFNNQPGADAEVLASYNEPSWNNPVVRIVNPLRADITPRLSGDYSALGVVDRMIDAMRLQRQRTPVFLELLQEELRAEARGTEQATLSMYCFWTGEKNYGQLPGVVATEAGFMDGREVVQVTYDPSVVSFEEVVHTGQRAKCADRVYTHTSEQSEAARQVIESWKVKPVSDFRPDGTPKYYLARTVYRAVPMTPLQAARANALLGQGQSPESVLSPRQIEMAQQIRLRSNSDWENLIGSDIMKAWDW